LNSRDLKILQAVSDLHKEGMIAVGRRLIETKMNIYLVNRTINNLACLGFLEGNEDIGWVLTIKGEAELERRGP